MLHIKALRTLGGTHIGNAEEQPLHECARYGGACKSIGFV